MARMRAEKLSICDSCLIYAAKGGRKDFGLVLLLEKDVNGNSIFIFFGPDTACEVLHLICCQNFLLYV